MTRLVFYPRPYPTPMMRGGCCCCALPLLAGLGLLTGLASFFAVSLVLLARKNRQPSQE